MFVYSLTRMFVILLIRSLIPLHRYGPSALYAPIGAYSRAARRVSARTRMDTPLTLRQTQGQLPIYIECTSQHWQYCTLWSESCKRATLHNDAANTPLAVAKKTEIISRLHAI